MKFELAPGDDEVLDVDVDDLIHGDGLSQEFDAKFDDDDGNGTWGLFWLFRSVGRTTTSISWRLNRLRVTPRVCRP